VIRDFPVTEERRQVIDWARKLVEEGFTVIDTETIGLRNPELCQIGIAKVHNHGPFCLMDQLIKPVSSDWEPAAIAVHGITPEQVSSSPTLADVWIEVLKATSQCHWLVMYNRAFDARAIHISLKSNGINSIELPFNGNWVWSTGARMTCAMLAYAQYVGEKHNGNGANKWQKLPDYGYKAHTAIGDAFSTAELILELAQKKTP